MKVQNVKHVSFKSVLKTNDNKLTNKLYYWLKLNDKSKVVIMENPGSTLESVDLILIDENEGLKICDEYDDSINNLYNNTDEELEKMLPKESIDQFKFEVSNPKAAQHCRGNSYTEKMLEEIRANLWNDFEPKLINLYEEFFKKAKTLSATDIGNAISDGILNLLRK